MEGAWRRPPKSLSDYGHTEPGRGAECWGKSLLVTLGLFSKVTRCKSGTHSSRCLDNGYVTGLIQHSGRLSGRLREQARSHIFWIVGCQEESGWLAGRLRGQARSHSFGSRGVRKRVVGCQGAFAGKPAPTVGSRGVRKIVVGCQGAFASKPAPTFLDRGVTVRWRSGRQLGLACVYRPINRSGSGLPGPSVAPATPG